MNSRWRKGWLAARQRNAPPDQVDRRDHQLIVLSAALLVAPANQAEQQAPGVGVEQRLVEPQEQRGQGQAEEQQEAAGHQANAQGQPGRGGNRGRGGSHADHL